MTDRSTIAVAEDDSFDVKIGGAAGGEPFVLLWVIYKQHQTWTDPLSIQSRQGSMTARDLYHRRESAVNVIMLF